VSKLYAIYFNEDGDVPGISVYESREAFLKAHEDAVPGDVIDPEKFDGSQTGWLLIEGKALSLKPEKIVEKWKLE